MKELVLHLCISCGKKIYPGSKSISFKCPSCEKVEIHRCETCRKFGNEYICPSCGFVGP